MRVPLLMDQTHGRRRSQARSARTCAPAERSSLGAACFKLCYLVLASPKRSGTACPAWVWGGRVSPGLRPGPRGARCESSLSSVFPSAICRGRRLSPARWAQPPQPAVKPAFRPVPYRQRRPCNCTVLLAWERLGSCCKCGSCRSLPPRLSGACHPLEGLGRGNTGCAPQQVCGSRG